MREIFLKDTTDESKEDGYVYLPPSPLSKVTKYKTKQIFFGLIWKRSVNDYGPYTTVNEACLRDIMNIAFFYYEAKLNFPTILRNVYY